MSWTYVDAIAANVYQALVDLLNNTDGLFCSFADPSAPSGQPEGGVWYQDSTETLKYQDSGGYREIGSLKHSDVDYDLFQTLNCRVENVAADLTPSGASVGRLGLHTGRHKLRAVVSGTVEETILSMSNVDLIMVDAPLNTWVKSGTAATTTVTPNTAPNTDYWLFDATTKKARRLFRLPAGYSADADVIFRMFFTLVQPETAGDEVNVTLWMRAPIEENASETLITHNTVYTGQYVVPAVNGALVMRTLDIPIDYDDGENALLANSFVVIEIGLADVVDIPDGIGFLGGQLLCPAGDKLTES